MTKTLLLLKVQMLGYFGINKLFHTSTRKEKVKAALAGFGGLLLALMVIGYSAALGVGYVYLGLAAYIPGLYLMICSVITLTFTFVKSNGTLFAFRDYDTIMSLPVNSTQVIASRLLGVYLMNLLFTAGVMVPGLVVFAFNSPVPPFFWGIAILSLVACPALPMIVAMIFGAAIAAVSSKFRKSNLLTIILSFVLVLGIMALSFSLPNATTEIVTDIGLALGGAINRIYPPTVLFAAALVEGDLLSFGLFLLANGGISVAFVAVLSRFYGRINSAMFARRTRGSYRMGAMGASSPLGALYRKELRRLFSSVTYLLNTCMGIVLMVAAAAAVLLMNPARLDAALEMEGVVDLLRIYLPFFAPLFVTMSSTTSASLNIEGKTRWVALSLPVAGKEIFTAKILVNLTLLVPAVLLSDVLLILRFRPDFATTLLMVLMPLSYSVFVAVLGLRMNLAFPKYDWASEQQAVKQSLSVGVTMILTFLALLVPFLLVMFFPGAAVYAIVGAILVTSGVSALLYRELCNTRLYA